MRLYERFADKSYHTSIATTFGIDFDAYENIVLPRLRGAGCRNNILISDARMLTHALAGASVLPRHAGRLYTVNGVSARGAFHPKLFLQCGRKNGRLILGSANLTASGLAGNLELVGMIACSDEDTGEQRLISQAWSYTSRFIDGDLQALSGQRDWMLRRTPWLREATAESGPVQLADGTMAALLTTGQTGGIGARFAGLIDEPISRLIVISPYWDKSLRALSFLIDRISPAQTALLLEPDAAAFPKDALNNLANVQLYERGAFGKDRFIHAKAIIAQGQSADHVLIGSANCTVAALGTDSYAGENEEVCLYRRFPAGGILDALGLSAWLTDEQRIDPDALDEPVLADDLALDELATRTPGQFECRIDVLSWYPPRSTDPDRCEIALLDQQGHPIACTLSPLPDDGQARRFQVSKTDERPSFARVTFADGALSVPAIVILVDHLRAVIRETQSRKVENALRDLDTETEARLSLLEVLDVLEKLDGEDGAAKDPFSVAKKRKADEEAGPAQHRILSYEQFIAGRRPRSEESRLARNSLAGSETSLVRGFLNRILGMSAAAHTDYDDDDDLSGAFDLSDETDNAQAAMESGQVIGAAMRLNRIEIENFKGVGERQSIDLKPITLLFGPNSAGKSTILQALHYLREILERNNPDPDQTIAGGLTDLGGFASLVHGHDLGQVIRIKARIDLRENQGSERLSLNSGGHLLDTQFANLRLRYLAGENTELKECAVVHEIGVVVEVSWSDLIRGPYVSRLTIEIDGEDIAQLRSPPQEGLAELTRFNWDHPLLRELVDPDELLEELESPMEMIAASEADADDERERGDPFGTPLGSELYELSRQIVADSQVNERVRFRVKVDTKLGALPDLDRLLAVDLVEPDKNLIRMRYARGAAIMRASENDERRAADEFELESLRRAGLSALLDEIVLGPVRIVRDYLKALTYIGPLREIPTRGYRPRLSPDESRWAQGLAAWDVLHTQTSEQLLDRVNEWLSSEFKLRTGYHLQNTVFKQVPSTSRFHQLFQRGIDDDDLGELQELYASLKTVTEFGLLDLEKGLVVAPSDVGVGISQMVPVVVACLTDPDGMVAIEQPELHIHPAIQVGLGDLFIEAATVMQPAVGPERSLLIETHSEHILLRILRRIRETTDNELPPGVAGLTADELSVIYVETGPGGVQFRSLGIDEHGEFRDQWPHGFFEERAGELF